MPQFEFNLITFLLGIVSGIISTLIGQWAYNKWIAKAAQTEPMTIFEYSLKDLTKTKKVQFNRALHNVLQEKNIHLVKAGSLWVPTSLSEKFQDLVD